jgi:hypothetical protein
MTDFNMKQSVNNLRKKQHKSSWAVGVANGVSRPVG